MNWKEELKKIFGRRCRFSEPLEKYTTYQIGGPAEALVLPKTRDEWVTLIKLSRINRLPLTVLGLGSNVLVSDKGLPGIVASTRLRRDVGVAGTIVTATAGAPLDDVVLSSVKAGLSGMEKMSGIPGTVGGAVWMNAGAFGQETFDKLVSFWALDSGGRPVKILKSDVKYGYRKVDGLDGMFILSAEWKLDPGDARELKHIRLETLKLRADKQPLEYPSAGSVFKRPLNNYASKLIDECELKGVQVGGAQVSDKHAGFIVNKGGATASDVKKLIAKIRARVRTRKGVDLELEQILLGEFDA
jgi:UDP-N-acetylmuramate dehydrogenase